MKLTRLAALAVATYGTCFLLMPQNRAPEASTPTVQITRPVIYTPATTTTTTSTTTTTQAPVTAHDVMQADLDTLQLPADVPCQEWASTALEAGWPAELLPRLLRTSWKESRCQNVIPGHPAFNGSDHGPLQLNEIWMDEIAAQFGDPALIDDPATNFAMAWEIWKWHQGHVGCGWQPWGLSC